MGWRISALVLKGVAAVCLGFAVFIFMTPHGSTSWPTTEAHALSSHFTGVVSPGGGRRAPLSSSVFQRYGVEYEYTVDGVRYTGSGAAREAPRDGQLRVYVDPHDPASSVIEPGIDGFVLLGSLAMAGLAYAFARMVGAAGGR